MNQKRKADQMADSKQDNSTTKTDVLSILKKRKRGYSRYELAQLAGVSDRAARQAIAELRDEGYMIGTRPDGGYSYGQETDFLRAIKDYEARRNKESKRIKNMKRTLEIQGQEVLDV